jgi:polysaccharide export outer membrane protein
VKSNRWLLLVPVLLVLGAGVGFAEQQLETVGEANARIHELAASPKTQSSDYVIGSGDLLRIEVFDVPDLSREVRVSESGFISLSLIPVRVRAAGLTPFQLEEKLAELLQANQLVMHPHVSVFVREHLSQPITVIGAVQKPMVYEAIRSTTLLEVLSEAGGIASDAGSVVLVTRRPKAGPTGGNGSDSSVPGVITIRLRSLLDQGDPKSNILVYGGDVVSVPRAGIVYVVGAVNRPGGFVLQTDSEEMTTLKALALAGGMTGTAKPHDTVLVRKNPDTGKNKEIPVDVSKILARKAEDVRLYSNDILFVPDSTGKKALRRMGDVAISLSTGVAMIRAGR